MRTITDEAFAFSQQVDPDRLMAACKAFDPDLFSDDEEVAHRSASPLKVEVARSKAKNDLLEALAAYSLALRNPPSGEAGEPVAWQSRCKLKWQDEWGEWRPGRSGVVNLIDFEVEERPLYALPTIKEPTE